jgi:hypothetical protein
MSSELVTIKSVDDVKTIMGVLNSNKHHSFPVLNTKGVVIGLIPRNFVIIILQNQYFYNERSHSRNGDDTENLQESRTVSTRKINLALQSYLKQKQKYKLDPSVSTNVLKSFANIE